MHAHRRVDGPLYLGGWEAGECQGIHANHRVHEQGRWALKEGSEDSSTNRGIEVTHRCRLKEELEDSNTHVGTEVGFEGGIGGQQHTLGGINAQMHVEEGISDGQRWVGKHGDDDGDSGGGGGGKTGDEVASLPCWLS
eukprot:1150594-Pelagomonas_calceolata.AAC.6